MEVSYKWLKEFIELPESPEEVGKLLTGTGLEVEAIDKIGPSGEPTQANGLEGVVIGEVLSCTKHPDADKLSLTTVDVGTGQPLPIVCGAPNVAAGQKVVVALVGATLHPTSGEPFQIKKAKIRGAVSEGMICAEDEIGLGTSHAGIIVLDPNTPAAQLPNGTPADQYFDVSPDYRISIGLTPNRIDAASHLGVARDLRAVLSRPLRWNSPDAFSVQNHDLTLDVRVDDTVACPRYTGLTISGLTVRESPDWLKQRLLSIGLNPINNIVDITNFVCHDLGQPLHAFDADKIAGGQVIVKTLPEGTPFVTLDGVERKLTATDLMICDAGKPMCIAGVFGGQFSGVTAQTTRIFLESAYFSPMSVRKTAQHHGLKTDASFRFERGTDPNMPVTALKRAALLIQEVAGSLNDQGTQHPGVISSDITDLYPAPVAPFRVPVRYRNVDRLIGIKIEYAEIHRILEALDIQVEGQTNDGFVAVVPPYRVDVTREADVIEEILRIYGLDNVPLSTNLSADSLSEFPKIDPDQWQSRVGQLMAANGFHEILTLSLTRPAYHDAIRASLPGTDVTLLNPLSEELSVMRQTLLFSSLETLVYNLNRRQKDLKLFEFGKVYHKTVTDSGTTKYVERMRLSVALTGNQQAESWLQKSQPVSFHDLSTAVQRILNLFRIRSFETQPADPNLFQYGLTYVVNKKPMVSLGLIKGKLTKLVDLKQPVFYADFDWSALIKAAGSKVRYQEVSRFPDVRRDLSLVLDKEITFEQISRLAYQTERKLLRSINTFDVFDGEQLGIGKKSYSVSFVLQDPAQTLTDATIDKTMQRLMSTFEKELGAVIRK
ncbi:phenylalanine--tRNA ligase subunit beta [Spirosoma utsteinense]|uniref:Phenylalanine--tRNA ligase beta subunit n=1 Tax=Spirosoma utsteinense TaxID=2585773 RepID=A0ABR6W057_9BACT|nr:phenylalanine--tRNA ligase subunit beta [Spirosoma utsteinense]MBC3786561.1 phenylalanyl-tRNA synthetase beta chain [Spirosoma utsteinense]MBC3789939.1 phenylalanyl-tRNA synthetase beta chain [Spirosoma utsteinense]